MACVMGGYLSREELHAKLGQLPLSGGYMLLERPDAVCLEKFSVDISCNDWASGRVFSSALDMRWQKNEDMYHVVVITDNAELEMPGFVQQELADDYEELNTCWLLWGRKESDVGWVERRIPQILNYPIEAAAGSRIAVKVTQYVHREKALVEFYRFTGLEEVSSR